MVSKKKELAAAFKAAAEALGVDGEEVGDLLAFLSTLSEEELDCFPIGSNNKATVAFLRSLSQRKASAASLRVGSAAGAGAAAGVGTTRAGDAGAAAGLGVGSAAGAGAAAAPGASSQDFTQFSQVLHGMSEELRTGLVDLRTGQVELRTGQVELRDLLSVVVQLQSDSFMYSTGKASSSRQADDFKSRLQNYYGDIVAVSKTMMLRCMLLDVQLPFSLVTAAHLFKHCWREHVGTLLGLDDINNPGNGLLLCKPLEHAFDDSRICFEYTIAEGMPTFTLVLLDLSLSDVKLKDYAEKRGLFKQFKFEQLGNEAQPKMELTFNELQGKPLVFVNENHPFKRCLGFQAKQAIKRARKEGWLPANWEPSSALSYTSEAARRVHAWLQTSSNAPPPPDTVSEVDI